MQTVKSVSWVRMVLAFGAVLLVAGSGLAIAAGPGATYVPTSSVILGPSNVSASSVTQYTLEVTFNDGSKFDFPSSVGPTGSALTFSAVNGAITSSGVFTAGAAGRAKVAGAYTQNNVTTSASRFIFVQ
jgi:hypothetical protein